MEEFDMFVFGVQSIAVTVIVLVYCITIVAFTHACISFSMIGM